MKFTLGMILEARERLKGVAQRTGLVQFKALSDEHSQIYLKTEDLQNTGSFKVRGAYIKIASLSEEERACGVIASSAGNHAQGVALAAKAFGVPATIVMPAGAPLSKVKATRELGANVVLHGSVYDDAYAEACRIQQETGATFIHPFDDGNGRMGRLWQTLILSKWKSVFAYMPVETIVRNRQDEYYESLGRADAQGEATKFVEFMLQALYDSLAEMRPAIQAEGRATAQARGQAEGQSTVQATTQVKRLLVVLEKGEQSASELMRNLGLKSARSFRSNLLNPALAAGLAERTQPDSPRSPTQRYRLTALGRKALAAS